jgi:predicted SprT family Zn-dependent metalloprotease
MPIKDEDTEISDIVDIAPFSPQFSLTLPREEAAEKFALETFQFWHTELGANTPFNGLTGLSINNRLTSTLGYCYVRSVKGEPNDWLSRIELAGGLVRKGTVDEIVCTILHELGHSFCGIEEGHGARWTAACDRMGLLLAKASPVRPMSFSLSDFEWAATCSCGLEYSFKRMTRRRKTLTPMCSTCGDILPKFKKRST